MIDERGGPVDDYSFRDGLQDACCGVGLFMLLVGLGAFDLRIAVTVVGGLLFWLSVRKP